MVSVGLKMTLRGTMVALLPVAELKSEAIVDAKKFRKDIAHLNRSNQSDCDSNESRLQFT